MQKQITIMLEDSLDSATPQQKIVARYMIEHFRDGINQNAKIIAAEIGVSEATVIRYVKSLGFETYSDFRNHIIRQEKAIVENKLNFSDITGTENEIEVIEKMAHRWNNTIAESVNISDTEALKNIVNLIHDAKVLFVYSNGFSNWAAMDLANIFRLFGKHVEMVDDIDFLHNLLLLHNTDKLLIAMSKSGEDPKFNPIIRLCHDQNLTIVGITGNTKSTLAVNSKYILKTLSGNPLYPLRDSGMTILSQLFITHSIYHLYTLMYFQEGVENWDKIRQHMSNIF
ncbi:MAG: MurR/RpiR family transcriptional regulator [Lactobacillaceae bacterium]|nr:MurR/RpiR family transcriptional regulator [Lactobacillaceae bacterium]